MPRSSTRAVGEPYSSPAAAASVDSACGDGIGCGAQLMPHPNGRTRATLDSTMHVLNCRGIRSSVAIEPRLARSQLSPASSQAAAAAVPPSSGRPPQPGRHRLAAPGRVPSARASAVVLLYAAFATAPSAWAWPSACLRLATSEAPCRRARGASQPETPVTCRTRQTGRNPSYLACRMARRPRLSRAPVNRTAVPPLTTTPHPPHGASLYTHPAERLVLALCEEVDQAVAVQLPDLQGAQHNQRRIGYRGRRQLLAAA